MLEGKYTLNHTGFCQGKVGNAHSTSYMIIHGTLVELYFHCYFEPNELGKAQGLPAYDYTEYVSGKIAPNSDGSITIIYESKRLVSQHPKELALPKKRVEVDQWPPVTYSYSGGRLVPRGSGQTETYILSK